MNSPSLQDKPGDLLSFTKKSLSWPLVCLVSMQEFVCNVWEAEEGGSFQGPPLGARQAQCSCHLAKLAPRLPDFQIPGHISLWIAADTQQPAEQVFSQDGRETNSACCSLWGRQNESKGKEWGGSRKQGGRGVKRAWDSNFVFLRFEAG